ncbi:alpha/beta fold hydrolase [Actinoplanes sp. URMC 104]|uniref:alpha/beta fold hydrolase n=1 Tax=Actinoplanes sp. URMC 104 TaxID=3423409 RepID=UPI003F1C60F1
MSTFALIHGAGDVGWYWHLVEAELRSRGHDTVAPDLPAGDDSLTLDDYADAVVEAVGDRSELVVVGQSFGAFTAPLVAARRAVERLVLVAGMVPAPGEAPDQWWSNTGYEGGLVDSEDPYVVFYHDVDRGLAEEAVGKQRAHPSSAASAQPWPLPQWPDVPTRFVLCTEDRLFPAAFLRRVAGERLGVEPVEIAAGHCVALSRPVELADALDR